MSKIYNTQNLLIDTGNGDILDNLLYPYVYYIAKKIPIKVTPNQISIMGFLFAMLAVLSLLLIKADYSLLFSSFFLFCWWLFDACDGIHARTTNQCSQFGGFLDHFLDTVSIPFILFALLIHFNLFTPLYVLIGMLRLTIQALFFLLLFYQKNFHLPSIGPTVEIFILITQLCFAYLIPTIPFCQIWFLSYLFSFPFLFYMLIRKALLLQK